MNSVRAYRDIRDSVGRRDRSMHDKTMSLAEAAALVPDGASLGIGGSIMSRTPMAMIWQLIKSGRRNLNVSRSMMSTDGDWVVGSGIADRIETSWCAQGISWGLSKVARDRFETGAVVYEEWSHLAMGQRYHAGAMGVPFMPMRTVIGSDLERLAAGKVGRSTCPFTGEEVLLVPALNPEVAIIHVQRCDRFGNAQIDGLPFMDIDLACAADRVILTTEEIVSTEQIRRAPERTRIPFFCVEAVVDVPFGSAPHECFGLYEPMMRHLDRYVARANSDPRSGFEALMTELVHEPADWTQFLERIGVAELVEAMGRGRSIYRD
ncbi:CoA transferase subunit A [Acuticoccus sediminis]